MSIKRGKLIFGNWKMHGNHHSIHALLQHIKTIHVSDRHTVAVFPSFVYLEKAHWELRQTGIQLGAQAVSEHPEGAYTGEISAAMLKDIGCHYVLVGHSERRQFFGETDTIVPIKFVQACRQGLTPVLCVGETADQYTHKQSMQTVLAQLNSVLNLTFAQPYLSSMVIAYEPVWAIGTGLTATPEHAQQIHQVLREALIEFDAKLAKVPIIYGGSVKAENAKPLFAMSDIDGVLVGGASLNGEEFRTICHLADNG